MPDPTTVYVDGTPHAGGMGEGGRMMTDRPRAIIGYFNPLPGEFAQVGISPKPLRGLPRLTSQSWVGLFLVACSAPLRLWRTSPGTARTYGRLA